MKKAIILLLVFSFLLQSCYSYKTINNETASLQNGKTYKIKVLDKQYKGEVINFSDSVTTLKMFNWQKEFKTKDISKIKQRNFSVVKTVLLPVGIVAVIVGLFALSYETPQMGEISFPSKK